MRGYHKLGLINFSNCLLGNFVTLQAAEVPPYVFNEASPQPQDPTDVIGKPVFLKKENGEVQAFILVCYWAADDS
jgi:hypothetical protein